MRRPLSQVKRRREESGEGEEHETVQPQQKSAKSSQQKSTKDIQTLDEDYENQVEKLQAELQLETPSRKRIKRLMKSTFTQRRAWITAKDSPTVQTILERFPCLKESKYVSTDFWSCHRIVTP